MAIGENIRNTRLDRGMTQKQVADACGMADSAIRKYESGQVTPKLETLQRIAAALGVEWTDLVPEEEQGPKVIDHMKERVKNIAEDMAYLRTSLALDKLNLEGKQKAVERVEELTEIPRYQATPSVESTSLAPEGTDTTPDKKPPEDP